MLLGISPELIVIGIRTHKMDFGILSFGFPFTATVKRLLSENTHTTRQVGFGQSGLFAGLWDRGVYPHFCDARDSPPLSKWSLESTRNSGWLLWSCFMFWLVPPEVLALSRTILRFLPVCVSVCLCIRSLVRSFVRSFVLFRAVRVSEGHPSFFRSQVGQTVARGRTRTPSSSRS